jgi:hypothetical protein
VVVQEQLVLLAVQLLQSVIVSVPLLSPVLPKLELELELEPLALLVLVSVLPEEEFGPLALPELELEPLVLPELELESLLQPVAEPYLVE